VGEFFKKKRGWKGGRGEGGRESEERTEKQVCVGFLAYYFTIEIFKKSSQFMFYLSIFKTPLRQDAFSSADN